MIRKLFATASLFMLSVLAMGSDSGVTTLQNINEDAQSKVTQALTQCAEEFGVSVSGPAVYVTLEDTSAAIMAATGVDKLTRADFNSWQVLGVAVLVGPHDAEYPSGTYLVQAQAKAGTTQGCFQFVDSLGNVVQEGDLTLEEEPKDKGGGLKAGLGENQALRYWCGYPYYPYFRIYPRYWWGCWRWYYRWSWGYLRFRYCWWPYNCCGSWYWWWRWRC